MLAREIYIISLMNDTTPNPGRRKALQWAWGGFAAGLALLALSGLRYLFPNAPPEQKRRFRLDKVRNYPPDQADARHRKALGIYIVRSGKECFALNANCTHLGCRIEWMDREARFKCPCHGSGFSLQGLNLEGPAPRALERFQVEIGQDGYLWVDLAVKYLREDNGWQNPLSRAVL
jgi:cytochrome b6-f complex iron-sulfur subunit